MIIYSAGVSPGGKVVRFSLHPFTKKQSKHRVIARGISALGYFNSGISRKGDAPVEYLSEAEAIQWLIDGEDQ